MAQCLVGGCPRYPSDGFFCPRHQHLHGCTSTCIARCTATLPVEGEEKEEDSGMTDSGMQKDEANNEDAANDEDEANILDALFDEDDDDSTIFAENSTKRVRIASEASEGAPHDGG